MVARVTRQAVEILADGTGNARVTRLAIEVLAAPADGTDVTASSAITFTQSNTRLVEKATTASSTITFTQTNARAGVWSPTAGSSISFSQSADRGSLPVTVEVTGSSALSFTHVGASSILTRTAANYLNLASAGILSGVIDLTGSSLLSFSQSSGPGLIARTGYSFLDLDQFASGGFVSLTATPLTASSSLSLSDSGTRAIALASGTALTKSNTLAFAQKAIVPIELTAEDTISFTQSGSGNAGKSGTTAISFTQTVVANHWRSLTASNAVSFSHGFSAVQFRDGLPVLGDAECDATKLYAPYAGGDNAVIRPVAPGLTRKTDVEFFYPTGQSCAATNSIILRTPNFGDRDRNQYSRINRESRGGSLQIFRDPEWPSVRSLVMDFSGIKDSEVDGVIEFLETTLGLEIAFRDWNGRLWTGLIVNPDSAITRTGVNRNDISVEMEVTESGLEISACSELEFAQDADRGGSSILGGGPMPP